MKSTKLMAVMLVVGMSVSAMAGVYDFDSLTAGTLDGQDGWANFTGSGTATVTDYDSWSGVSGNAAVLTGGAQKAKSGINWGITGSTISIETIGFVGDTEDFRVALAGTTDGTVSSNNEVGMQFGYQTYNNRGWFVRGAAFASGSEVWWGSGLVSDGVYRLVLDVDLAANGGDGSMSLSVQQLADGTGVAVSDTLTAISDLQNKNAKILSHAVTDVTAWDGLYVRGSNGFVDSVTVVPEPATMALLGLGALVLRRKK